jgi:hypothetical protein
VFRRLTRGRRYVDTNEDERAEPVRTTPSLATLADEMTPSAFRTNSFLIHFPPAGHEGGGPLRAKATPPHPTSAAMTVRGQLDDTIFIRRQKFDTNSITSLSLFPPFTALCGSMGPRLVCAILMDQGFSFLFF